MVKNILTIVLIVVANSVLAHGVFHPAIRHTVYRPHVYHHTHYRPICHHHHHGSYISPWVGLAVGTVVGAAIAANANNTVVVQQPIVQTPVVVQQPVVVQKPVVVQQSTQVWVEGRYIDQIQPNGTTIRVWQPGHWETR